MNRPLTYAEFWAIIAGLLVVVSCVVIFGGCSTISSDLKRYNIQHCHLILTSQERVQDEWDAHPSWGRRDVTGFYDVLRNEIWCTENEDGMPDFWTLGHELWHQEQLGGKFHK